jgi:acetoin utilization deacetylase AcuC-like enzyme
MGLDEPHLASTENVLRVHHPKHLERLGKSVDFDSDTPYYPEIETHARRAAGAAIGSVDLALSGRKGFALIRPPGHHATPTRAMRFCYLNSIAIAASYALGMLGARIAEHVERVVFAPDSGEKLVQLLKAFLG